MHEGNAARPTGVGGKMPETGRSRLQWRAFRFRRWSWAPFVLACVLLFAASAAADTAVNTTAPFTFSGTNMCVDPPEDFVGTGGLHLVVSSNLSTSGMVQSHLKANLQGLQAATLSGKTYQ